MLNFIETVLNYFESCFSRKAAFNWFATITIGLMLRSDKLGVTSVIRDLALKPGCYDSMLHFFRASSWSLEEIRKRWFSAVGLYAPLCKEGNCHILVGDGVKQSKEGRRMPGVKRLFQESYGRSTIDVIKNICSDEELKNIKFNGIILHQKMLEIEYNSDILLSMGNANTDFVPSKIFEYMSMGGKILHIYSYKRDPVLPYLEKYENSCCLNVDDDIKENQNKLEIFLKKNSGRIPFSKLKNMYMMNTPEYTVDLLVKSADTN